MGISARSTLRHAVTVSGIGIHTGESATVTLHPAETIGAGIVFRTGTATIPARYEYVVDTGRCTVLGRDGATVSTVEHLLSACAGLGITDMIIDVTGPELPIGDGSSQMWRDALASAGQEASSPFTPLSLTKPVIVTGKGGAFVALYPSDTLRLTVAISFEHPLVSTQIARFDTADDSYASDIAPARTFGFIEEVEALRAAGLAKGGSFDNAIVVYPDHYSVPLHFENELARHKLLDLMGDLLLFTGYTVPIADIIAVKPSHRLNCLAAQEIARHLALT